MPAAPVGRKQHGGKGAKKQLKGSNRSKQHRYASRENEEAEIKQLEERIAAEAPKPGTLASASTAPAVERGEATDGGGPALTGELFADLPISQRTLKGLKATKFVKMTEIQRGAIPHALAGRDILGEAKTGSGKTLAFLVPLMELLFRQRWTKMDGLGGAIISPTRELSYQIFQVLQQMGREHEFSAGCMVGGRDIGEEQSAVCTMNILVVTPGRLLQHLDSTPGFEASNLQVLVLDEADRILDFSFEETIHNIITHLPDDRQSLLFSATLRATVQRLSRVVQRSPEVISVHQDAKSRTPDRLKQLYMTLELASKVDTLFYFLRSHSQKKIIVFVSACKQVRFLYETFRQLKPGPAVMELHGRQSLTKRMITFDEFANRERAVALICTDIAARGIDFPEVDWVVQVDCPDSVDSYIHRVGRTARYENSGHSVLFLLPSESAFVSKLQAASIGIKSIATKAGKVKSVQHQIQAVVAGDGAIKHLAQRAFVSYIRSVGLMKDKEVFSKGALAHEEFAASLGLAFAPDTGEGPAAQQQLDDDCERNPLKTRKNQTALQRLREKIRAAKRDQPRGPAVAAGADGGAMLPEDSDSDDEGGTVAKKKVGQWARRQARLNAARSANSAKDLAGDGAGASQEAEDDFLVPAGGEPVAHTEVAAAAPSRKRRLKIKRDGIAQDAAGKHVFFAGEDGSKATSSLGQFAEDMQEEPAAHQASQKASREAFLGRVARELAKRDTGDAAASRARIKERHQKMRRLAKDDHSGDSDEGGAAVLGGSGSPSSAASSGTASNAEEERSGGSNEEEAAAPRQAPAAKRRSSGKRRKGANAAREKLTRIPPPRAEAPDLDASGADLTSLEREALSRLSTGGLFC